jgi:hypothetical protein
MMRIWMRSSGFLFDADADPDPDPDPSFQLKAQTFEEVLK